LPDSEGVVTVCFATPLEEEYVQQIAALDPRLRVLHRPDLIGRIRFSSDHVGASIERTPEQQADWDAYLAQAEVLWDFDRERPAQTLRLSPGLRLIYHTSSGIATWLERSGLVDTNVLVCNAAGIHNIPMAEWAMFSMLAFARDFQRIKCRQRAHQWDDELVTGELHDSTLALIGLGEVGSEIARRARDFGMRVLVHRRRLDAPLPSGVSVDAVYPRERLHEMLAQADYLVLIVASTADTHHLIGPAELAALPERAVLINLARGPVVDQAALIEALQSGRLAGAALDVFDPEPLEPSSPLWDMPNVIITAHTISQSKRENERQVARFCQILRAYLDGQPIPYLVDKRLGYRPGGAE